MSHDMIRACMWDSTSPANLSMHLITETRGNELQFTAVHAGRSQKMCNSNTGNYNKTVIVSSHSIRCCFIFWCEKSYPRVKSYPR